MSIFRLGWMVSSLLVVGRGNIFVASLYVAVDLAFRFSPIGCSTSGTPVNTLPPQFAETQTPAWLGQHPSAMIVSALAKAPKLRSVKTELPTVWNEALLQVSCSGQVSLRLDVLFISLL